MDLAGHKRMFAERAKYLASFPPDNLLRKDEPPPPPPASLPPGEWSEETARQLRRAQMMQQMLSQMAEAEKPKAEPSRPGPLAQLLMRNA